MNRKHKKSSNPDEHLEALGDLLTQLRAHLTVAAEKKGTYVGSWLRFAKTPSEFYPAGLLEDN